MTQKILYHSEAAAQLKQVSGWVSADGRFFGKDEHIARYAGCTHMICKECGENEHERGWTCCESCRRKHQADRYAAMPLKQWDGEPLYCDANEQFFFESDELQDFCADTGSTLEDLSLIICEPETMKPVQYDDLWIDDLPEDTYLSDVAPAVAEAIDKVNEIIERDKPVLSWRPGKFRTTVTSNDIKSQPAA